MFCLNADNVKALIDGLNNIKGREVDTQREAKSNYWYLALKTRPVTWRNKINNIEALFPQTKPILDNQLWHLLFNVDPHRIRRNRHNGRFKGPIVVDRKLSKLVNDYIWSENKETFSDNDIERIHSLNGIAACLSIFYADMYDEKPTGRCISSLLQVFITTFAIRYCTDFAWEVFYCLREHLNQSDSHQLPSSLDDLTSKKLLLDKLKETRRNVTQQRNDDFTLRDKLILVAKSTPNN